jgi:hypothetical protein
MVLVVQPTLAGAIGRRLRSLAKLLIRQPGKALSVVCIHAMDLPVVIVV